MNYPLDPHGEMILQQYLDYQPIFKRLDELVFNHLSRTLQEQGIYVTSIEHRIKQEASLAGKLMRKGHKYTDINSLTDIVGVRIITFYTDDVDKVAAIVKRALDVDWKESVDKRKLHDLDSFGYNSLHYICRLPKSVIDDPKMPELNTIRFELQMRTALQHVWSTIEHDTGYKGGASTTSSVVCAPRSPTIVVAYSRSWLQDNSTMLNSTAIRSTVISNSIHSTV